MVDSNNKIVRMILDRDLKKMNKKSELLEVQNEWKNATSIRSWKYYNHLGTSYSTEKYFVPAVKY